MQNDESNAALRACAEAPETPCAWTLEDEDGRAYQTSCGEMFEFTDGGPVENKAKFCQYCGKALVVAAPHNPTSV
jgi:ribosomal protein S27AE